MVDAQRGAIEVKFALPQAPPAFLREDMTLSVEVETGRRERALVVPLGALRAQAAPAARPRCWSAATAASQERRLRLGLRTLEAVEVLEGLARRRRRAARDRCSPARGVAACAPAAVAAAAQRGAPAARREDAGSALSNAMGR